MAAYSAAIRRRRLSLTPLIDIVFILLLFFMVATSFSQHGEVTIALSGATSGPSVAERPMIIVSVHGDGKASVDGQLTSLEGLREAVNTAADGDEEAIALILTDQGVSVQSLIEAVDAASRSDVHAVAIAE